MLHALAEETGQLLLSVDLPLVDCVGQLTQAAPPPATPFLAGWIVADSLWARDSADALSVLAAAARALAVGQPRWAA